MLGVEAARQLLSHKLPEGVFLICSQMLSDPQAKRLLRVVRSDYHQANLFSREYRCLHEETVERFVVKLIEHNKDIQDKLGIKNFDPDSSIVVKHAKTHAKAANYNFMHLRLVYSDPDCWPKDGMVFDFTNGIDGYYDLLHEK